MSTQPERTFTIRLGGTASWRSCQQYVDVQLEGVPACRVVDSGNLDYRKGTVSKVAAGPLLRKRQLLQPDKTLKAHDGHIFTLYGKIEQDVTIYVRADALDQLLLGESFCRQLRII